jgi:hypothetical protein
LEDLRGRDHFEDLGAGAKILKCMLGKQGGWVGVDWMHMAQDRNQVIKVKLPQ